MRPKARAALGVGLLGVLATPSVVATLEGSLVSHLLIQMPLLALAGFLSGPAIAARLAPSHGGTPTVTAIGVALYWMLPRSMDAALDQASVDFAKFATLFGGVGVPLALGWPRLPYVARTFLLANLIPMLAVLGWLYTSAPVRVCNYYLVDDQVLAGRCLLALALAGGLWAIGRAFWPRWPARGAAAPSAAKSPA